jgi:hypothetical protein
MARLLQSVGVDTCLDGSEVEVFGEGIAREDAGS